MTTFAPTRRHALALGAAASTLALAGRLAAAEPLRVVASFSILADMVRRVAGDRAVVTTLVGADQDMHGFDPAPSEVRALAEADLVVVNGLGFEGWVERLVEASGYAGPLVVATQSIAPLKGEEHEHDEEESHEAHEDQHAEDDGHHHGALDPHAWQSPANGIRYVANIADALAAADPAHADDYRSRAAAYAAEIEALDAELAESFALLPQDRRTVVVSHDAFGYLGEAYALEVLAPVGVWGEADPSARDVAALIEQIREHRVCAVFVENIRDPRVIERIAEETGATVGGTLYSDALSAPDGPAPTYLDLLRHNAETLLSALAPESS